MNIQLGIHYTDVVDVSDLALQGNLSVTDTLRPGHFETRPLSATIS